MWKRVGTLMNSNSIFNLVATFRCTRYKLTVCRYNWGERERAPHLWIKRKIVYIFIYLFIYVWYVRIPYMHSALFVRDAIFPHVHELS